MSRIGKLAIKIPDRVKVTAQPGLVNVEGPKGKVAQKLDREMKVTVENGQVRVDRPNDSRRSRELHGLTRTLVANMILGVTQGFSRSLDIAGVGYKAELKGREIRLALGCTHPVVDPPRAAELKDGKGKKKDLAKEVGKLVAKKCQEAKIETVVFDRNGFMYHGRVAAVAEGAREGGLKF